MDPSKRVLKIFKMHMFQVYVDIFQYGTASIFRREPCNTHEMAKTVRKSYQLYYNTHPLEERPPWLVTFSIIVFIKSVYIGCCYRARNNRRLNITFTVQGRDGSSRRHLLRLPFTACRQVFFTFVKNLRSKTFCRCRSTANCRFQLPLSNIYLSNKEKRE